MTLVGLGATSLVAPESTAYLAANLDLDGFLALSPPSFGYKHERFVYLLDLICRLSIQNKHKKEREETFSARLKSSLLKKKVHNYEDYLNYLVERKYLEKDDYYVVGKQSKTYSLTDEYLSDGILAKKIRYSEGFKKRIDEDLELRTAGKKKYPELYDWFTILDIDYDAVKTKIQEMWNNHELSNRQVHYYDTSVENFRNKELFFVVDSKGARLYSNLTSMPKIFRPYLSCLGEKLVSIDIGSSQPFMATCLLNYEFYKPSKEENGLVTLDSLTKSEGKFNAVSNLPNHIRKVGELFENGAVSIDGLNIYRQSILNGSIYETFAEKVKDVIGNDMNRDVAKKELCKVLFSKDPQKKPSGYKFVFSDLYPDTFRVFHECKRSKHSYFAILLQAIESHIVLDNIVKRFVSSYDNRYPVFTIHDSVITTSENEDKLLSIMREELMRMVGIMPRLKVERWGW